MHPSARILALCVGSLLLLPPAAAQTERESISYGIGVMIGQSMQRQGLDDVDEKAFTQAIHDVFSGAELRVSAERASSLVREYMQARQNQKRELALANDRRFLQENAERAGVRALPSGLQYEVLQAGSGRKPAASDEVTVHYTGTLLDGTVFDSSVQRGQPATFAVGQVIKGWTEALQLMPEGSRWKLFIPYDLAYGERGAGDKIPPFSTLVFEVELIKVN